MTANIDLIAQLPALVGLMLVFASGFVLIASAQRTRGDVLLKRMRLVRPYSAGNDDETASGAAASLAQVLRRPAQGLTEAAEREVVRELSKIGFPVASTLTAFLAIRVFAIVAFAAAMFFWSRRWGFLHAVPLAPLLFAAMGAAAGWFLPSVYISRKLKLRTKAVHSGLPTALELLVVCVEAGLSLEDALDRVVAELRRSQPEMADELALTLADLKILPSRDLAFINLAARVDIPSVRAVVNTLVQTMRYGTPLAQTLRIAASEMRNDYMLLLEERANRLPALMTLPVILFMMPTIFLITGGPAALRLIDAFGTLPR